MTDGIFINLTVPPGVEAGVDSLTFEYGGNELDVLVPAGSVEGDVLRIQVGIIEDEDTTTDDVNKIEHDTGGEEDTKPAAKSSLISELGGLKEDGDNNCKSNDDTAGKVTDNEGITTVELFDGKDATKSLKLYEYLPGKAGKCTTSNKSDEGDGTHGMVWPSGRLLAQALTSSFGIEYLNSLFQLDTQDTQNRNIACLELGSGLGVCGLALVSALKSCRKNPCDDNITICLTDQGENAIDLLKANIEENHPPASMDDGSSSSYDISAESLVWGKTLKYKDRKKFDIILGSDLLYNTQVSYAPLICTIKQHLHLKGTVILGIRWRKPDLEREFFCMAESMGLHFELWNEFIQDADFGKRTICRLSWKEYGNPECEASNLFFNETMVFVANKKTALANVSEKDMEAMSDEEHAIFEEMQCQVYIGRYKCKAEETRKRKQDEAALYWDE